MSDERRPCGRAEDLTGQAGKQYDIANPLRGARKAAGLTQKQLAETTGIPKRSKSSTWAWERGD